MAFAYVQNADAGIMTDGWIQNRQKDEPSLIKSLYKSSQVIILSSLTLIYFTNIFFPLMIFMPFVVLFKRCPDIENILSDEIVEVPLTITMPVVASSTIVKFFQ